MSNPEWMEEVAKAGGWEGHRVAQLEKQTGLLEREAAALKRMEGAKSSMKQLGEVGKQMNKSQFFKSVKGMGGMFKSMMGASPKTAIISKFMGMLNGLIKPLGDLLKPLQLGLDIAGGAVSAFVGSALGPMYDAFQPMYDVLVDSIGPATELGTTFGESLAPAIEAIAEPLGEIIVQLGTTFANILIQLVPLVTELFPPFMRLISTLADMLLPILEEIVPFMADQFIAQIIAMMDIFQQLMPIIGPLVELFMNLLAMGMTPLTIALQLLSSLLEPIAPQIEGIGGFISFITKGVQDLFNFFIKGINSIMNTLTLGTWRDIPLLGVAKPMPGTLTETGAYVSKTTGEVGYRATGGATMDFSKIDLSKIKLNIPSMQGGGINLSEGIRHLHANEVVIPLDKFTAQQNAQKNLLSMMTSELIRLNEQQAKLNRMKENKYIFERMK